MSSDLFSIKLEIFQYVRDVDFRCLSRRSKNECKLIPLLIYNPMAQQKLLAAAGNL
jgi:hypothetical protein